MLIYYKKYLFLVMLFSTVSSFTAQNYFDSLATYIQPLSNEKKVELIKAIPFDKMNSNTSAAIELYQKALDYSADNQDQLAIINEKLALAYYYKGDYDLSVQTSSIRKIK